VNAKTTYFIQLKSCSNTACETKIFEAAANSLSAYELVNKVQDIAKAWGLGNGSKRVLVSAETCPGGCVVSEHAVEVPQPEPVDEDEQPVSITITKAQVGIVLAALSRRYADLDDLGGDEAKALAEDAKAAYQSIDAQVYA